MRVRQRRTLLGMSQEKLGEAVGLTFQQIQKYERGANRIGSSRLYEFSKVLDVPEFRKTFSDFSITRGMVPIGYHVYDRQNVVFKVPVTNLAGFAGKRTRVLASETEQASIAALGAAPVPMSLPEVVPALQQGTIDAVSSAIPVYVAFRYQDVAPHVVDTALWTWTEMDGCARSRSH